MPSVLVEVISPSGTASPLPYGGNRCGTTWGDTAHSIPRIAHYTASVAQFIPRHRLDSVRRRATRTHDPL